MGEPIKSIFKFSSELGLWMGLYLFLMSACLLASVHLPSVIMLLLPLALGMPVVMYFLLARMRNEAPQYRTFTATWLGGTWICIFGSLICAALSALWITLFDPDFVAEYISHCLELARTANLPAEYSRMADAIEESVKKGRVPSPMEWVFSMIWFTIFAGLIVSFILSLIMNLRRSPKPDKFP